MQGYEYVEHYRLEYQREANGAWFRYRNRRGEEVRYFYSERNIRRLK